MQTSSVVRIAAILGLLAPLALLAPVAQADDAPAPVWHADYVAAVKQAVTDHKLLLIWFRNPAAAESAEFEKHVLEQPSIAAAIARRYVAAKIPLDAKTDWEAQPAPLLAHASFYEMQRLPGLAIVDFTDADSPQYGLVVSAHPFARGPLAAEKLAVLLDLPRGSLTQRTLIYAVRTHPDLPASTQGHLSPILLRETASHAAHQASITLQGHHHWEQRFHAINAQLPGGLLAQEVCAESWPGQGLVEAAEECVDSWRQSPGHWDAVSRRHILFGYDMQRGANGTWYATGIFATVHRNGGF